MLTRLWDLYNTKEKGDSPNYYIPLPSPPKNDIWSQMTIIRQIWVFSHSLATQALSTTTPLRAK